MFAWRTLWFWGDFLVGLQVLCEFGARAHQSGVTREGPSWDCSTLRGPIVAVSAEW